MPISTAEVEKIAELAKLKFDSQELERFVDQFQEILEYIAKLEAVPTEEAAMSLSSPMYSSALIVPAKYWTKRSQNFASKV